MTMTKRKRARKACIPCHRRKRKCDAEYPCGMCTTYDYNCMYTEHDEATYASDSGTPSMSLAKRGKLNDGNIEADLATSHSPGHRSSTVRSPYEAHHLSTKSPKGVTAVSATSTSHTGMFDEQKSRYAGSSAAMAFPHVLGVALGSSDIPKLRSFAYNFGIRPEEASSTHGSLNKLISESDLACYSDLFFSVLASIFDVVDPRIYAQRCRDYFHGSGNNSTVAFGAIAAGVAALGSFLSPNRSPQESDLVQYAKAILDDPASMRTPRVDHIVAWGLRVLYLRATARPNNAWIASCTVMHLCEAVGLHEETNVLKIASIAGAAALGHDADRLRRIFWLCWAGHNMLSYEYDRSSVRFRAVTCQNLVPTAGFVTDQFVHIAQIIPSSDSPFRLDSEPSTPRDELFERLKALDRFHVAHPFLVVTKADLAFCFYRRIYQLKTGVPDEVIRLVISHGNAAVQAAEELASQGWLLWNVVGSVFQYACILLAIDTSVALVNIPTAFKGLENLVKAADTGLTRDALSMARNLLGLSVAKKRNELAQLEAVDASYQSVEVQPDAQAGAAVSGTQWELDWDQFLLDPYLLMPWSSEVPPE